MRNPTDLTEEQVLLLGITATSNAMIVGIHTVIVASATGLTASLLQVCMECSLLDGADTLFLFRRGQICTYHLYITSSAVACMAQLSSIGVPLVLADGSCGTTSTLNRTLDPSSSAVAICGQIAALDST